MLTEDNKNVWSVWREVILPTRGDIVHGQREASADEAERVLAWAEQLRLQLTLRLVVAPKHPLHQLLSSTFAEAARLQSEED